MEKYRVVVSALGIVMLFLVLRAFIRYSFVMDTILFSIAVLGFDLLYGYLGLLSFGHMLYVGFGAYMFGITIKYLGLNPFISFVLAIALTALLAMGLGLVVLRRGGAYFALTMLTFNFVFWFLFMVPLKPITGGFDGLWYTIPQTPIVNISSREGLYAYSLIVLFIVSTALLRIIRSPFGYILRAIKENETRVVFLGYNSFLYKFVAYVLSAVVCSVSGALYSIYYGYTGIDMISPYLNLELIFAAVIGGTGTFFGAFIGTIILIGLKDLISAYIVRWEAILGITIIIVLFKFREGVFGYLQQKIPQLRV